MPSHKARLVNRENYPVELTIVAIDGPAHGMPIRVEVPPGGLVPERKAILGERYFLGFQEPKIEEVHYYHAKPHEKLLDHHLLPTLSAVLVSGPGHHACDNVRPIIGHDGYRPIMGVARAFEDRRRVTGL